MNHSHVFYRKRKHCKPVISHGEGIYLWDMDGKRYIDASGGAVVVNVGHGVKEIADAVYQQLTQVAYVHATMFTSRGLEEMAERLTSRMPLSDARLFFMTSGAEAIETAIKFSRQYQIACDRPSRYKVIGRWGGYHGATMGALAVTGKTSMRTQFMPQLLDMPHIPPVYCYRCAFGLEYPQCSIRCADELEQEIKRQGADTIAAFIAEPIAGATLGAVVPPAEYWPRVREICSQYNVLLIVDEVMTGMGRAGKWFAIEEYGVTPDILCLGKGVSGGYLPLSVTVVCGELVDSLWEKTGDFNHGGTFSHQPSTIAAGLATLNWIEKHDLVVRVENVGRYLGNRLHELLDNHLYVGDIRGRGLMWGIEFVLSKKSKLPFPVSKQIADRVFEYAFERGLIVYAMNGCVDGVSGDHVMVSPPFVVTEEQVDEIVLRLKEAIDLATNDI